MRMICPNCGAQYEVDASVIPEAGRDVQCSNCGHTWFQRQANLESGAQQSPDTAPAPAKSEPSPPVDQPAVPELDNTGEQEPTPEPSEAETTDDAAHDDVQTDSRPSRQSLDEGVAGILREEAARETSERAEENIGLETQQDLGLDQGASESGAPVRDPTSQIRATGEHSYDHSEGESSRRDLLPDIEEINSTLAASPPTSEDDEDKQEAERKRRGGFRRGFSYAIVLFAIMALIYVFAPKIAEVIPQSASALIWYVDWINGLRTAVDAMMLSAVDKLTGLLAQLSGDNSG